MPLVIHEDQALTEQAIELMLRFAERTGLTSEQPQQRYLWTDAFAVCNFLGLARATGGGRYLGLALALVDRVHDVLGKHRPDDLRVGWLSGLPEQVGALHPTCGGLRIGKRLPERRAHEPFRPGDGMGSGWSIFSLPDAVDARAGSSGSRHGTSAL